MNTIKYIFTLLCVTALFFSCKEKEKTEESNDLVNFPDSGPFSKFNEVKVWKYTHPFVDTLIVTNEGITDITGKNTLALKKEHTTGCAIDYYYFKDNKCIIDGATGNLFFFAKKTSSCSTDSIQLFSPSMIILDADANIGDSWTTTYSSPVETERKFMGIDTVTTPAGTFNCQKYEVTSGSPSGTPKIQWFSEIGLIKEEQKSQVADTTDPLVPAKMIYQLVSYQ